jgi:hypothetical protein
MPRRKGQKNQTSETTGRKQLEKTPQSAFERLWLARHRLEKCRGKGVLDMPGVDTDHKKLNWFLWKRRLLDDDGLSPKSKWRFSQS